MVLRCCCGAREGRSGFAVFILLKVALLALVFEASGQSQIKCNDPFDRPVRCMPEFENAAFNKIVKSNNTCGSPPSEFCVQTTVTSPKKECELCSANDTRYKHPSIYITDIKEDQNFTWWQSDTLLNNPERKIVTLTLELEKSYDVTYIRIRFRSPRPESMAIYKRTSSDPSAPWVPYQYFSASCNKTFGVLNTPYGLDVGSFSDDQQKALCTDEFSSISPLTGGNIAFSTLEGRPGAEDFENSPTLQEWVTASAIRIDLVRMNTFGDEVFGDPNVLKSYYFAIFDLAVGGRCKCNGHASSCRRKQTADKSGEILRCECKHNTAGIDCEVCEPLYNDRKWARATEDNANECLRCNCHNMSDSCVFDQQLFDTTGRGGRCIDCKQNTAGVNCERCKENFYRATQSEPCRACNCNPAGSESQQCDSQGKCTCKPGVTGQKCDRCLPNYFGFSQAGCRRCQCNLAGTDPNNAQCNVNGECSCKRNVIGASCDQCRAGYYGLEESNPYGCKQCFCSGHSTVCKAAPGYAALNLSSSFIQSLEGWTVQNEESQDVTPQYGLHVQEGGFAQATAVGNEMLFAVAPSLFLGDRRSSYAHLFGFSFRVGTTDGMKFQFGDITLEGANGLKVSTTLTAQNNPTPTTSFQKYTFRLHEDPSFGWQPQLDAFDFQKLLSNLEKIKIRLNYADQGTGLLDDVFLETAIYDPSTPKPVNWVEECVCPPPHRDSYCEACNRGFTRQRGVRNSYDLCIPCECHNHADICHPDTGVCNCTDNTEGKNCDKCVAGYYGSPTHGTPDDCKPCDCHFAKRCIQIGVQVICTDCPEGHSGNDCGECADGYYGDPKGLLGQPTRCQKCNCSGNIDPNALGNCNPLTGDCLKCIHNTRNGPFQRCEQCSVGYYGSATAYPKPPCTACLCYPPGTATPLGHKAQDPLPCDAQGRCTCLPNVVGDKCDGCIPEYWNVGSGKGCQQCLCSKIGATGNNCSVQTGQCPCKTGVTGRTCDICKPDFFKFTESGCTPCNCNPQGSLNVSCNMFGVCTCRPGVLGVKCDSCQENHHNLSAGCIRCPPCYDDVQTLVNSLRGKIRELVYIIDHWNTSGKVIVDANFEKKLKELSEAIERLVKQAEQANKTDIALQKQIKVLIKRVESVQMKAVEALTNTTIAEVSSREGSSNMTAAWQSINRTRDLLKHALALLITDGIRALNESILSANSTGDLAKRLIEMAAEARKLASKHEREAGEIEAMSHAALNTSKQATTVTRKAVLTLNQTLVDIQDLLRRLKQVELLSKITLANATLAKERSQSSLDKAEKIYVDATAPFPDIGIDILRNNTIKSKAEALNKTGDADRIIAELKVLVSSFDVKEDDVRKKMVLWAGLMARLRNLTDQVKQANLTAYAAVKKGADVLKKAFDLLKLLEGFNEQIARSKNEADEAKKLIPEIERLIKSANDKTKNASDALGDAQKTADEARSIANEAQDTAERAKEKAQVVKEGALSLTIPTDNVTEPAKETSTKFRSYVVKADQVRNISTAANKTVQIARSNAKQAINKVETVMTKLLELLKQIDNLKTINESRIRELEDAVKSITSYAGSDDFGGVNALNGTQTVIKKSITKYTLDLERLRREIDWARKTYESLPDFCPRKPSCPEGTVC